MIRMAVKYNKIIEKQKDNPSTLEKEEFEYKVKFERDAIEFYISFLEYMSSKDKNNNVDQWRPIEK